RLDCTVPFARPAAGLPGTCGGYITAVRAAHFLATPAVTADALPFMHTTAMQTNPTSALSNFTWANMVCPKAKHRGLTIASLSLSWWRASQQRAPPHVRVGQKRRKRRGRRRSVIEGPHILYSIVSACLRRTVEPE